MKEFIDNHEEVHTELEGHVSSQNPKWATAQLQRRILTCAWGLEEHLESLDLSQKRARWLDISQRAFAQMLSLDDDLSLVTFDDSLDLMLEQVHESTINPDSSSQLSLNQDYCQNGQASARAMLANPAIKSCRINWVIRTSSMVEHPGDHNIIVINYTSFTYFILSSRYASRVQRELLSQMITKKGRFHTMMLINS